MKKLLSVILSICLLVSILTLFPATVSAANETPTFSQGTVSGENGSYTIGSDSFSAFISTRANKELSKTDLRIILAADRAALEEHDTLTMTITFKDENGAAVKTFVRSVGSKDFPVYLSASAAGIRYTATPECYLFGVVITDIPNIAWRTVTASLSEENEAPFVQGSVGITSAIPDFSITNKLTYQEMALNSWSGFMNVFGATDFFYSGYFWDISETIEAYLDGYEATGYTAMLDAATQLASSLEGRFGTYWSSVYHNDDIAWAIIAYTRLYNLTGNSRYLAIAEENFNMMYNRAYSDDLGGGLFWSIDNDTKNACVNCPAAIGACLLAEATEDDRYYAIAEDLMNWVFTYLFGNDGSVYDSYNLKGEINSAWIFSYNQGTFVGACDLLYRHTENTLYYQNAVKAIQYIINNRTTNGVFSGQETGDDGHGFRGIMTRWFYRFGKENNLDYVLSYLRQNADSAYQMRNASGIIACDWRNKVSDSAPYYTAGDDTEHKFFSFVSSLALMFNCQSYRDTIPTSPTSVLDAFIAEVNPISAGEIHDGVRYSYRNDVDVPGYYFRIGYKSEMGLWQKDEELGKEGIQLTSPNSVYIRNISKGEIDYTRYEIDAYFTPNWWEVVFSVEGFTPAYGNSYEIALFINTNDNPVHKYPNSVVYWKTTTPFSY